MKTLLDQAVALMKTLPEDEQERAATVLMALAEERSTYILDDDQLEGIDHAIAQANHGAFASDADIVDLFDKRL